MGESETWKNKAWGAACERRTKELCEKREQVAQNENGRRRWERKEKKQVQRERRISSFVSRRRQPASGRSPTMKALKTLLRSAPFQRGRERTDCHRGRRCTCTCVNRAHASLQSSPPFPIFPPPHNHFRFTSARKDEGFLEAYTRV